MNHLIIRTYDKDDYLARLCYESWIRSGYEGDVIFYCQKKCPHPHYNRDYSPQMIDGCGKIIFHDNLVSNFGGAAGAESMIECWKQINFSESDYIISCDTDIVIFENPIPEPILGIDLLGTGGLVRNGELYHISGQLQVISGRIIKEAISNPQYTTQNITGHLVQRSLSMNDDTYISMVAHLMNANVKCISNKWLHRKLYNFACRTDWDNIIEECRLLR